MKKVCTSLREHATNVINFEKKKMLPLKNEKLKSNQYAKACHICEKRISKKFTNDKNYQKVRDHCHFTWKYSNAAHGICNLKFNVPNEISVVFHNDSNYDYHFIIKELANSFEGKLEWHGENTENYKIFSFPIEKELMKIDKDDNENLITLSYKIIFSDSARFMTSSLSNLFDNLAEGIYKMKCK